MADIGELKTVRRAKVKALQEQGIDPYPENTPSQTPLGLLLAKFSVRKREKKAITIAGRIMGLRGHGGALFLDVRDDSGTIQVLVSKKAIGQKQFTLAKLLRRVTVLTKSLRPLPDEWYGLQDTDERFRDREVDFLLNQESAHRMRARGRLLKSLRATLDDAGFLEVETPVLQSVPGGATAKPFKTKLNALDLPLYLRVAPELYLKRLLVGGFERVYELGRAFRNEGMDATHNPEFTILEFYWAYQNLDGLQRFTERLIRNAVKDTLGATTVTFREKNIQFGKKFAVVEYRTAFKKHVGCDPVAATDAELTKAATKYHVPTKGIVRSQLVDHLFKKVVMPTLPDPCFVVHHPLALSPLAKQFVDEPGIVRRFQVIAGGLEIVNAYAELNDPDEQTRRFQEEGKKRRAGDEEAQQMDADFVRALEYGMPPAAGFGMGIDRFVMLLTDTSSIREVIAFPTMRPRKRE
jgi:lysyl-tRNA synthetase class 2